MSSYVTKKTPGDTVWFKHDRFGMFIHFGLYAMPAKHEWIKTHELITEEKYDKYFKYFNPDLYDPKDWAKRAKAAGMKYAVITTKHHDGFCMFDSKFTDYKVTNSPYGKDVVKEFVDAFRAEGLRVGFYYSLIDWHHPEFTIDNLHPRRYEENAAELNKTKDMKKYAKYLRDQLTELLTNYGKIDVLWFDFSYPGKPLENTDLLDQHWWPRDYMWGKGKEDWESEKLIETIRSIQPHIIINNRTGIPQDLWTPEQVTPTEWLKDKETGELLTWESCQTLLGPGKDRGWGYNSKIDCERSPENIIRLLINNVSCGGNMMMNVGPNARGELSDGQKNALSVYEEWMHKNSRSIYGCTMAEPEFVAPRDTRYTQSEDGKRLYLHLIEYDGGRLELPGLLNKIDYAQFLHDASEIPFVTIKTAEHGDTTITQSGQVMLVLPQQKPNVLVPVVEIFLK